MSEDEPTGGEKLRHIRMPAEAGNYVVCGEGLVLHLHDPDRDGIRVSDSRGWTAAGDISAGVVEAASAGGVPSKGEHLTLETAEFLVRRLNADGAAWDQPVLLEERVGRGVDCQAQHAQDRHRQPLQIQVTRPAMPEGFWKDLSLDSKAQAPPGAVEGAARSLWTAIEDKRQAARHDVVLALNAIRTPWFALPPVVREFRDRYGEAATRGGWAAIWVVGANETVTERLDCPPGT